MNKELYYDICRIIGSEWVKQQEPMKKHTTFRIGGNADYYLIPHTVDEIQRVLELCKHLKIDYYILGRGSNLLVSDNGYRGIVIQILENMSRIQKDGDCLIVQAGASLWDVAHRAAQEGLEGFEFAAGIPGTVGGAVMMNAGAYGGEMKQVVVSAKALTMSGDVITLNNEDLKFGYRESIIGRNNYIVLETVLQLKKGNPEEILTRMKELQLRRESKQPLEFPSAGSTFKRPDGYFAGKLIMDAGLCGFCIGDAQVSEKHCGFVINRGNATAKEILDLITHIKKEVKRQFGVELAAEVKMLGDFDFLGDRS